MIKMKLSEDNKTILVHISHSNYKTFLAMTKILGKQGLNYRFENGIVEGMRKVWLIPIADYSRPFSLLRSKNGPFRIPKEVREKIEEEDQRRINLDKTMAK